MGACRQKPKDGGGDAAVVIGGRGDGSDIVVAISEMVLTLSLLEVTA